jgi:hypothetical protein
MPFRVTLSARGVRLLAQCGQLPRLSIRSIADKSKADPLKKAIVCMQAVWYLAQYIGRLQSHLPVTLLELNTLGHALCALLIYLFWWSKPLDIKEPIVLSGDWVESICAYMWMGSTIGLKDLKGSPYLAYIRRDYKSELRSLQSDPSFARNAPDQRIGSAVDTKLWQENQKIANTSFRIAARSSPDYLNEALPLLHPEDVQRLGLASAAINRFPAVSHHLRSHQPDGELVVKTASTNWPGDDLLPTGEGNDDMLLYCGIILASATYGGLHATAWNEFFPTWQERLLWRISSVIVATTAVAVVALFILGSIIMDRTGIFSGPVGKSVRHNIVDPVFGCLVTLCYVCSRIFLVVEAFISLREVPIEVYKTPLWSQLLPHI